MTQSKHVKAIVAPYFRDEIGQLHVLAGISDKYATSTIELLGGGCAFGETPIENAERELLEETSGVFRTRLRNSPYFSYKLDNLHHATVFYFQLNKEYMDEICNNFPQARRFYLSRGIDHYTEMRELRIIPMSCLIPIDEGCVIDPQSYDILKALRAII